MCSKPELLLNIMAMKLSENSPFSAGDSNLAAAPGSFSGCFQCKKFVYLCVESIGILQRR